MSFNYQKQDSWYNDFGHRQSPIDLSQVAETPVPLELRQTDEIVIKQTITSDNGIQLLGNGQSVVDHRQFTFRQAHFHAPNEHPVGHPVALECHLVHQNAIGQLLVVALMAAAGPADPLLSQLIEAYRQQQPVAVSLGAWWPSHGHGFRYLESLTTPPLTEGVEWVVVTDSPLTVSEAQVAWFSHHEGAECRQVQPRYERPVQSVVF